MPNFRLFNPLSGRGRRRVLLGASVYALLLLCYLPILSAEDHARLPLTTNLQQDGRLSAQQAIPILLLVSREHCAYCRLLKREVLEPTRLGGHFRDRVIMREILIDPGRRLQDFQGRSRRAAEFAADYKVSLTPTLLFLDSRGRELAGPMVGINTLEMFGLYLEAAIDEAQAALRKQSPPTLERQ